MPEFHQHKNIKWKAYVTTQPMLYDIILGQDLMQELGLIIDYKTNTLNWDDATIAMKPVDAQPAELFEIPEGKALKEASNRLDDILAAKYAPANLEKVVETCKHLDSTEKLELYQLLTEFEDLFDGTLGHWNGPDYSVELKPGAQPYHARPYPIPKAYKRT